MEERLERGKIYCVGNACDGNYSQFVLSRPQGSVRIAERLMHEYSKEPNKLCKEKDSKCGLHLYVRREVFVHFLSRTDQRREAIGARVHQNEKEKQTLCVQTEEEGKLRCSSRSVARAKEMGKEVKKVLGQHSMKKSPSKESVASRLSSRNGSSVRKQTSIERPCPAQQ